jgi:hypothetical protein
MTAAWPPEELARIGRADELRIGGNSVDRMVTDDAAAATLRLVPEQ